MKTPGSEASRVTRRLLVPGRITPEQLSGAAALGLNVRVVQPSGDLHGPNGAYSYETNRYAAQQAALDPATYSPTRRLEIAAATEAEVASGAATLVEAQLPRIGGVDNDQLALRLRTGAYVQDLIHGLGIVQGTHPS